MNLRFLTKDENGLQILLLKEGMYVPRLFNAAVSVAASIDVRL